jgi:hypothetical protein
MPVARLRENCRPRFSLLADLGSGVTRIIPIGSRNDQSSSRPSTVSCGGSSGIDVVGEKTTVL